MTHLSHEVSSSGIGVPSKEGVSEGLWAAVGVSQLAGQSVALGGSSALVGVVVVGLGLWVASQPVHTQSPCSDSGLFRL